MGLSAMLSARVDETPSAGGIPRYPTFLELGIGLISIRTKEQEKITMTGRTTKLLMYLVENVQNDHYANLSARKQMQLSESFFSVEWSPEVALSALVCANQYVFYINTHFNLSFLGFALKSASSYTTLNSFPTSNC
jgi:hypothetical protein